MANATLGTGAGQWAISSGEVCTYLASGTFLVLAKYAPYRAEVEEVSANGVDGVGAKFHGLRDGNMVLLVTAVRSTEDACVSGLIDKISDLVSSGTIQYTVGGVTGIGRVLGEQSAIEQPRSVANSLYRADAAIVVKRLRSA